MKDEIREILDIFKQVDLEADVGGCSNCPRKKDKNRTCIGCLNNAKDKLLDYITNLQKENERLKQTQYVWSYDLDMQLEDYKSRVEKAYEELTYMSSSDYVEDYDIKQNCWIKLSNILQNGSDTSVKD